MAPSEPAPSSIGWSGRGVATRLRGGKSVLCAYGRISTVDGVTPQHDTSRARAAAKDRISRWIGGVEVARAQAWSCRGSGRPAAAAAYLQPWNLDRARRRGVAPLSRCGRVGPRTGRVPCRGSCAARPGAVPVAGGFLRLRCGGAPRIQRDARSHDRMSWHDVYILAFFQKIII